MKSIGKVYLIGAGCGDWELITLKGLRYLKTCDCLIYDRLISKKLLEFVSKDCEKIYVGKQYGYHSKTQEEINSILVEKAMQGKTIARLKGGDVFVFGRGGEEIQALQENNIPYEVVSGISSSIAVPSHVGIPVTHRSISRSFHVITGHTLDNQLCEDFSTLAKLHGTLIFLMSLTNLDTICKELISNGMDSNTPCAIISKGTTPQEKVFKGELSNILEFKSLVETPSIFVVGETVNFNFKSTIEYPLSNMRVGITGTDSFTSKLEVALNNLGAITSKINHLEVLPRYENFPTDFTPYTHIVLTSSNGVDIMFKYIQSHSIDIRNILNKKFATVGQSTADTLSKYGIYADIVPNKYTSRELAKEILKQSTKQDNYLILRASNGSNVLTDILEENSIQYTDIKTYDTVCNVQLLKDTSLDSLDYLIFGSSKGIHELLKYKKISPNTDIICIGEVCKSTLDSYRLNNNIYVPEVYNIDGILNLITNISRKD